MKARGLLGVLACALALAALLPGAASAKPGYVVKPKVLHVQVPLPASNGYSATLTTEGHRQVTLSLSQGEVVARYVSLGKVTRKGIEADFGDFGRVSLRFHPRSRFHPQDFLGIPLPASLHARCKGRRPVGEKGVFSGNIRFSGEHGYSEVRASRLKGNVVRTYRRICKSRTRATATAGRAKFEAENVGLLATARQGGVQRYFLLGSASIEAGKTKLAFTVAIGALKQKIGRVAIDKFSLFFDEVDSVEISPIGVKPITATIKVPKPFEGTASYLKEGREPPTWSGDLGLRLPGSGLVPLTGPEFDVGLCRPANGGSFSRCFDSLLEEIPLAQGSGLHSQPSALTTLSLLALP
jgi:hypothetical protein